MTMADARTRLRLELEQVARGDRAALRRVYQLTSAKLLGVCVNILGDRALAEDVLQEVYLKVWQSAAAFDPERASPITWLCLIARNRAVDWRRASGRYDEAIAMAAQIGPAHAWHDDADERQRLLHGCIDTLQGEQRNSIQAAFVEGFTYAELARRSGTPLGTVKSWVRRGLTQLRKCIEDA